MDGPLSKYIESEAPHPTQAALDRMLARVAKVRIYAGGMNWDRPCESTVLAETGERGAIGELKEALRILDGAGGHCMCDGEPTLELLGGDGKRLAVLGLHHGVSIRWSEWKDDARLVDGKGMELMMWLDSAGVPEPFEEYLNDLAQQASASRAWDEWLGAMPEALKALPETTWSKVIEKGDLFPLLAALAKAYPDAQARALALLEWHAYGGMAWSGHPTYENLPAAILAQFPEKDLVRILAGTELSPSQLCGAARFLACNEPGRSPGLPSTLGPTGEVVSIPRRSAPMPAMSPGLRAQLLWSCIQGTDDDGRSRAETAFLSEGDRKFVAALRTARKGSAMMLPSDTPFAENAKPEALAAYLAAADAAMPKSFDVVLQFEARPAGPVEVLIGVRGDDQETEAGQQTVRQAIAQLPRINTTKSALRFAAWYAAEKP